MVCCAPMVSRVYFEVKIEKLFLCEIITFNKFCATPHKCYMRINKQLIKLVYNDEKNLAYIFEIITFNKFCATPHKCYMRIN